MNDDEKVLRTDIKSNLTKVCLEAVLLYGLTLDDEDPSLGVLLGARRELALIANLAEIAHPGMSFDIAELVPVLEGIVRRLDVSIELMTRAKKRPMTNGVMIEEFEAS